MKKKMPKMVTILAVLLLISLPVRSDDWRYIVEPGDNLWILTERYLPDLSYVKKLQFYNSLSNPYLIPPGSIVRIPLDWLASKLSTAVVVSVQGKTFAHHAVQSKNNLLSGGEQIGIDDKIITGEQSSAVLQFKDGSRVLLHDNTEIQLQRIEHYPDSDLLETELVLKRGQIETEVPVKAHGQSLFKIVTPSASTAVRGTFLRTGADITNENKEQMRVEVLRGHVSVSGSKSEKTITKGYGIVIAKGDPPGEIIQLLPAPEFTTSPELIDRLSTVLAWVNIGGGDSYRVQVFDDSDEPRLVWYTVSDINRISVPDLPDGRYTMKVRGIDHQGLEGKDATHHYTLDARPEPPLPASPDEGARVENNGLILRWSANKQASGYHLQLSDQKNFAKTLVDETITSVEYINKQQLIPNSYYWRIATQTTDEEGPFSDVQMFTIIPPAPKTFEPQGDNEHLIFRWQKGAPGFLYQMQLAKDEAFTDVVLDKQLTEPRLELDRPTNDRHYLRMRLVADNGFKGNWSTVQFVDPPANEPWYLLMLLPLLLLLLLI